MPALFFPFLLHLTKKNASKRSEILLFRNTNMIAVTSCENAPRMRDIYATIYVLVTFDVCSRRLARKSTAHNLTYIHNLFQHRS